MDHHSQFHPDLERTGDQLKKIFNKLACTNASLETQTCHFWHKRQMPSEFSQLKRVRELLVWKIEGFAVAVENEEEEETDTTAMGGSGDR